MRGSTSGKNQNRKQAKRAKKVKKPGAFIYYLGVALLTPFFKFRLGAKYDRRAIKGLHGPAIVVCPHISNIDFVLVGLALYRQRPNFVVSEHFMNNAVFRWLLNRLAAIPKKMCCSDISTVRTIMRAREAGRVIAIFPEGRLTCFGRTLNLADGTAELIKHLGIDVYSVTCNGAYLTLPKWSTKKFRPGRIQVDTAKVIDKEELAHMSAGEVEQVIEAAILHDEDFAMEGVSYRCSAPASGLDGIIYKCPACGSEFTMITAGTAADGSAADVAAAFPVAGDEIRCAACGFSSHLDNCYRLHGGPFSTINQWYFWQQEQIDLDIPLESDTLVSAVGTNGRTDDSAGSGHIRMDRENISFDGEVFGEPMVFTESTSFVKAFPATISSHFNIYHDQKLYGMHLQPDPRTVIKWVIYLDKLNSNVPTPEGYIPDIDAWRDDNNK